MIDAVKYVTFGRWGEGPVIGSLDLRPTSFEVVFDGFDELFSFSGCYGAEIRSQGDSVSLEGGCEGGCLGTSCS